MIKVYACYQVPNTKTKTKIYVGIFKSTISLIQKEHIPTIIYKPSLSPVGSFQNCKSSPYKDYFLFKFSKFIMTEFEYKNAKKLEHKPQNLEVIKVREDTVKILERLQAAKDEEFTIDKIDEKK